MDEGLRDLLYILIFQMVKWTYLDLWRLPRQLIETYLRDTIKKNEKNRKQEHVYLHVNAKYQSSHSVIQKIDLRTVTFTRNISHRKLSNFLYQIVITVCIICSNVLANECMWLRGNWIWRKLESSKWRNDGSRKWANEGIGTWKTHEDKNGNSK